MLRLGIVPPDSMKTLLVLPLCLLPTLSVRLIITGHHLLIAVLKFSDVKNFYGKLWATAIAPVPTFG